MPLSQDSA